MNQTNSPSFSRIAAGSLLAAALLQAAASVAVAQPSGGTSPGVIIQPESSLHSGSMDLPMGAAAALSGVSATNPDNVAIFTSKDAVFHTVSALRRTSLVQAGGSSKEVIPAPAPKNGSLEAYLEVDWSSFEDKRQLEIDGDRFAPRIGLDYATPSALVLGGSFTFSYEDRASANLPIRSKTDSYIFNLYAGKTFADWIHVGATLVYAYESQIAKSFGGRFYGDTNVFSVSPFIGLGHTFGNFSFSTSSAYVYQHNDVSIDASPNIPLDGGIDSHTYLQLTELEYAVTDKFSVGALFNTTVVIDEDDAPLTAFGQNDDFWVTVGARLSYQLLENVNVSVQFEADLANDDYNHYLTSAGVTWSF